MFNCLGAGGKNRETRSRSKLSKKRCSLQKLYPKFYFKQKVTEEFVHLADETIPAPLIARAEKPKSIRADARHAFAHEGGNRASSKMRSWLSLEEFTLSNTRNSKGG